MNRPSSSRIVLAALVVAASSLVFPAVSRADDAIASCATRDANLTGLGLSPHPATTTGGVNYTVWSGVMSSWDGIPLAADVTVPDGPVCLVPLVSFNHGYGASKSIYEMTPATAEGHYNTYHWNNVWMATQGMASLNFTARGFYDSCGPTASKNGTRAGLPAACTKAGRHYWISFDDMRYSVRDFQWLVGKLVDAGLADPNAVAVTGGSMGAGLTWNAAALNDRVACGGVAWNPANGVDPCAGAASDTVPWTSPDGVPLHIAAAVPEFGWADFVSAIVPNGRLTDGTPGAPAPASTTSPVGIPTRWVSGFSTAGIKHGFFEPAGVTDPVSGWGQWFTQLQQPIDTVTAAVTTLLGQTLTGAFAQWGTAKSPGALSVGFDAKVPVLAFQGMSDSIFSAAQAQLMWQKAKAFSPDYPMTIVWADAGHQPASNPLDIINEFADQANQLLAKTLRPGAAVSESSVTAALVRCGTSGPPTEVRAPDLAALETSATTLQSSLVQTTKSTGGGNEATMLGAAAGCPTMSVQRDAGVASWTFPMATSQVILGAPIVTLAVHSSAADAELNTRLWYIASGKQMLMSHGTYRLVSTPGSTDTTVTYQIPMTAWPVAKNQSIKLEVTGYDAPSFQASTIASTTTIDRVSLRLPTTDFAGYGFASTVTAESGSAWSGNVAHFPAMSSDAAAAYQATVDWGDGSSDAAVITPEANGWYALSGSHIWATPGTYAVTTTAGAPSGVTVVMHNTATVTAPPT